MQRAVVNRRRPSLLLAALLCVLLTFLAATKAGASSDELIGANIQDGVLLGYYGTGGEIEIPNTVTTIAPEAFKGNTKVTAVTIPGSVSTIGYNAFEGCTVLERVTFAEPKYGAKLTIRVSAFIDCPRLEDITIPACAEYVTANIFKGCTSLEEIKVDPENPYYFAEDGVLFGPWVDEGEPQYDDPNLALIAYPCGRAAGEYTIPETVNGRTVDRVWASGFRSAKNLTGIQIPATCTILGANAFEGTGLTEAVVPDTVTRLDAGLFEDCSDLTDVTLPSGMTEVPMSFFEGCASLVRVGFPASLQTLDIYAFRGCTSLTSLILPENLSSIALAAFEDCTNLKRVFIPESVVSFPTVDDYAIDPFPDSGSDLIVYVVKGSTGERWASGKAGEFGWTYQVVESAAEIPNLDAGTFSLINMGNKIRLEGAFKLTSSLKTEPVISGEDWAAFQAAADGKLMKVFRIRLLPESAPVPESMSLGVGLPAGMSKNAKLYTIADGQASLLDATLISNTLNAEVTALGSFAVIDPSAQGGEDPEPTQPVSLTLNKTSAALEKGGTLQLYATVLPSTATDKTVTWSSDHPGVATVSSKGMVSAVDAGTAKITAATSNGKTASCTVTVTDGQTPPGSEDIIAAGASLRAGNARMTDGQVPFTVSLSGASRIATVQLTLEAPCSDVSLEGQNGFTLLGDLHWDDADGKYVATAVLCYLNDAHSLFSSAGETSVARILVSGEAQPTIKLKSLKISGWKEDGTVAFGAVNGISPDEATFAGEKDYDVNGDGLIDQLDITEAQKYYHASGEDAGWSEAEKCDFDGSGVIDIADYIDILLHLTK